MTVKQKSYLLTNGSSIIIDAELAFTRPLRVKVEGRGFNLIQGTPVTREVKHDYSAGSLLFSESDTAVTDGGSISSGTKVSVVFKY